MSKHLRFTNKDIDVLDPNNFRLAEPGLHVFTTFVTHFLDQNKRIGILRPDLHLSRIIEGSKAIEISSPLEEPRYQSWFLNYLYDLIKEEPNISRQKIRIIQRQNTQIEIQFEPYQPSWSKDISLKSFISTRPLPKIKHTDFSVSVKARETAEASGADEALLVNKEGEVLEGAWSNIFWFDKDGNLHTTEENILPGITRNIISEICEVNNTRINIENLIEAEEVFITQSTAGITKVNKLDNQEIKTGHKTDIVKEKYDKYITENLTLI